MLLSSAAMVTNTIITVHRAKGIPGPNPGSATFLGIMWSATVVMGSVCGLIGVQWGLEGRRGGCCKEMGNEGHVDEEWKSEKTLVEGKKS
jgi:hypothetical protein